MPALDAFSTPSRIWFEEAFDTPTDVQANGWRAIAARKHALLLAPTGSGKTLAAFFMAIDRLIQLPADAPPGIRVVYVSPLKALVYDIERNLRAPLQGVIQTAARMGQPCRQVRVGLRTGDTSSKERAQQLRYPPDILVTTPESLFLLLGSRAREHFAHLDTVIVDEVHAVAPSKRGTHLALSLERLSHQAAHEPQRIGLSATVHPAQEVARYLGGHRPVEIIDQSARARLDLRIEVPVDDMDKPPEVVQAPAVFEGGAILGLVEEGSETSAKKPPRQQQRREMQGMWAAIYPSILARIKAQRATIVFVNSRSLCERMAQRLNEMAEEELTRAHHGSLSLRQRSHIEEALKDGSLRAIVATSSLELGIDMGRVDQVILVESPGSVGRGLQRIGRAGHHVGGTSLGIIYPKHRGDLLESAVVGQRMREGLLEPIVMVRHALDVLAQHLVAMCLPEPQHVDTLFGRVRGAAPYATLPKESFVAVLDMLSGTYPSDEFTELRPLLRWDRSNDILSVRPGAQLTVSLNAGVIPDRGSFGVFLVGDGPRVGELDEEMVHESRRGDTFLLGASCWRIEQITRDRVLVTPAPGEAGRMPFWRGEGPGRPIELGRAVGAMTRVLGEKRPQDARGWAQKNLGLDKRAADNLVHYLSTQKEATACLPTDTTIVVERFIDEVGDWRVCILSPFGARVHAPWALALEATLSRQSGFAVETLYTDDGIVLRFSEGEAVCPLERLLPDPEGLEELIVSQLNNSALFASTFRENAGRALLLPKRRGQGRTPLWQQRLRAKSLLAAAQRYPSFPIVLETFRHCLQDIFDVPALKELLLAIGRREVRVEEIQTQSASPFARSLAFAYIAQYLYADDAPLAERRAAALSLDRDMLRELLGETDLRDLLDERVIEELEAQLQHLKGHQAAHDADGLQRLLVKLGPLCEDAIRARCEPGHHADWVEELIEQRRAVWARVAKKRCLVAVEDFGRLRDALGVVPPGGLPARFLAPSLAPLLALVRRFARTHGPFTTQQVAETFALTTHQVSAELESLLREGALVHGALHPGLKEPTWCDQDVLKRLKRLSVAHLRREVAAVDPKAFADFLWRWHHMDKPRKGPRALEEAITQLGGATLSFRVLCEEILPARVEDFSLDMLELLCATGSVVWMGGGSLTGQDGRIRLMTRQQAQHLIIKTPIGEAFQTPIHQAVLDVLIKERALFTVELHQLLTENFTASDVDSALWDLVWSGHVTNDTLQPLRQMKRKSRAQGFGGRWSCTEALCKKQVSDTERALGLAQTCLERFGIVSREASGALDAPGGFSVIYTVLKDMEQAGRVRRGYFVEGLGGAQFAYAGAIERLRASRDERDGFVATSIVLSAIDPANPYGNLLPWPALREGVELRTLRRVAGAQVITLRGMPLGYVDASGHTLVVFAATMQHDNGMACLVDGLRAVARGRRHRRLTLKTIDTTAALRSSDLAQWVAHGFVASFDGLVLAGDVAGKTHA